jgi:hypothetical protein
MSGPRQPGFIQYAPAGLFALSLQGCRLLAETPKCLDRCSRIADTSLRPVRIGVLPAKASAQACSATDQLAPAPPSSSWLQSRRVPICHRSRCACHTVRRAPANGGRNRLLHFRRRVGVQPNPSLKLTRYGRRCKPGPRHLVHHRVPGLQRLPPRAA